MGNNSSSENHARFFRSENFSNDPSAFRVFVKKRNKFIPGWLKVNDDEIIFYRGGNNIQYWSLAHLRRYGYTCSGVFFFESGRRCATGEGLHTFQSHQAERIFHMVQSKIKIEEYARGSRAGSVASGRINSLVPNPSSASRIHPVQRFSSEGSNNEQFSPHHNGTLAPPPYNVFQEARRAQQNPSPNCPSTVSSVSAYARMAALRDRPHSVVSNIEHNVVIPPAQNIQPRPNPIQGNSSSSTLFQHMMHQKHGYALPPHMNSLAASASGSCIMNQSYHSALDSGSPWASQQQLDGDIVMEHVLPDGRRGAALRPTMNATNAEPPIRVAVPPPRTTTYFGGGGGGKRVGDVGGEHAYINVDLRGGGEAAQQNCGQQNDAGLNVKELHRTDRSRLEFLSTGPGAFQLPLYSPNGMPANNNPQAMGPPIYYPNPCSSVFVPHHPSSAAMQYSFHQMPMYSATANNANINNNHSNGATSSPSPYQHLVSHHPPHHQFMSQSVSGALPVPNNAGRQQPFLAHNAQPQTLLYTSNSLEQLGPSKNGNPSGMPLNYALIEASAAVTAEMDHRNGRLANGNGPKGGSNVTLISSSTMLSN